MIRQGWGSPNPAYRHFFTSNLIPDATTDQAKSFDELQRVSVSPDNAIRIWDMNGAVDVIELARKVTVPTLVLHCEGDRMVPVDEGKRIAAQIPHSRFVTLEGNNHVVMEGTRAFDMFLEEIAGFLQEHGC
jgi:pimeloyl-ACP methyl ester carboxylesterase